jgi:hypothetical protein
MCFGRDLIGNPEGERRKDFPEVIWCVCHLCITLTTPPDNQFVMKEGLF